MENFFLESRDLPIGFSVRLYKTRGAMMSGARALVKKDTGKTVLAFPSQFSLMEACCFKRFDVYSMDKVRQINVAEMFFHRNRFVPSVIAHEVLHAAHHLHETLRDRKLLKLRKNRKAKSRRMWHEEWRCVMVENLIVLLEVWERSGFDTEPLENLTAFPHLNP